MKILCDEKKSKQADRDIKNIKKILLLVGSFMVLEIWGHWTSNTLSLLADSIHLLVDVLGFVVSLIALNWTKNKSNSKMNFGYGRAEILGAIFSIFLIWAAVLYLIIESYHKYLHPHEINEKIFAVISIVGFIVNCACVFFMHSSNDSHKSHSENLNVRAVYVHVIGDMIQSIGVLIAGTITYFYPKMVIVDIICTIIFSILVLFTTSLILKDGISILAERSPEKINRTLLTNDILKIENVLQVVDMKIWLVSINEASINLTVLINEVYMADYEKTLMNVKNLLANEYSFTFVNVQIETHKTIINLNVVETGNLNEII
ncbi:hypothetical protein H311_02720 [Anncaliia algerae PRA109]|nr:hypothetical protein H311_02720 [Anncaliia algerae PRA109]